MAKVGILEERDKEGLDFGVGIGMFRLSRTHRTGELGGVTRQFFSSAFASLLAAFDSS